MHGRYWVLGVGCQRLSVDKTQYPIPNTLPYSFNRIVMISNGL